MADPPFIHLRGLSAYSLLEGALTVKRLAGLVEAQGMPAFGLADKGNMFGALEFSEAMAGIGVQPIIGVALPVAESADSAQSRSEGATDGSIVIYARSEDGYQTLMRLASRAFLSPPVDEAPAIDLSWLGEGADGLIVLTGGEGGYLDRAIRDGRPDVARERFETLRELAGDGLYVELQRYGRPDEAEVEAALAEFAYTGGIPLVATNTAYFAEADDFDAHDALMCLSAGTVMSDGDRARLTPNHRLRSPDEMVALFADLPEAVASTVEIARRCHSRPVTRAPILPRFASDGSIESENRLLVDQAKAGLAARLQSVTLPDGATPADYEERLAYEVEVIQRMNYSGYFLIVSDFIRWAKDRDIPVGPGRGSGAGSVVAWALSITDLDPIRFGLLFERFLNPERVSMPDFDIDFCPERRDEVIRYVQEKYGTDQVAQIITFGTLQARAVIRDIGRVYQMSYGRVDALCKLVPFNPSNPVSLADALDSEPELQAARDEDPLVAQLLDTAVKLEGLYRHPSTHAAGIVIGDRPLDRLVPLFRDPRSDMPVTQYNMKWVENAGLVKFDFLGLKTLTVIENTVALLKERGIEIDPLTLPLDDEKTYRLIADADTVGIFQLESAGMRDALRLIEPDRFEDVIALVALYRPGPMDNIPTYGARKAGREVPDYLHPKLEPILKETYGVIIYQEQVMEIARVLSDYSLGDADLLRRAMGKKIRSEMDQQRARFVDGAVAGGIDKAQAQHIFELVARFADYGFNKSHAAAYALVAYQTAYLKANYPVEFFAASMTLDLANTDKLSELYRDARARDIEIRPPDINAGGTGFGVRDGVIDYALVGLKNVGRPAIEHLVAVRADGPFKDLRSFSKRVDPKQLNRRALESLAAAGAFDRLNPNRAAVHAAADHVLGRAARASENRALGQDELFSDPGDDVFALPDTDPWMPADRLNREFEAVGFFLSGHPLDDYGDALKRAGVKSYAAFKALAARGTTVDRIAGVVTSRQDKRGRRGNRYAIVTLSDPTGQFEIFVFSELLAAHADVLAVGQRIIAGVEGEMRNGDLRLTLSSCELLDGAPSARAESIRIFLDDAGPLESIARRLSETGSGSVSLVIQLDAPRRDIEVRLPGGYAITPQISGAIKAIAGVSSVEAG